MSLLDDPSSFLRQRDHDPYRMLTGHTCPSCKDHIEADDDVALIQIVQYEMVSVLPKFHALTDVGGDFRFPPLFFHLKVCWSDLFQDLEKIAEDTSPRKDSRSHISCEICGSGIREWEVMGLAQYGEFKNSQRFPNHQKSYIFKPFEDVDSQSEICLSCLINVTSNELAEWEDVSENGECAYCTRDRCWRVAQCRCECHE